MDGLLLLNVPCSQEFSGVVHAQEKEMATHSSILVWKISWTEEPGGLQSMGLQTVGHDWVTNTYGGFWMISYQLMFPGVRSSVFSGFRLRPPASGSQPYSYSSLKTSPFIQQ